MHVEVDHVSEVREGLAEAPVVVVRGASLTVDTQVRLTAGLGTLVGDERGRPQVRVEDGRSDLQVFVNEQWHADLSWCAEGPVVSVLCAEAVEGSVAPTSFVDTVSAHARLTPDEQSEVRGWVAHHHVARSRAVRHGLMPEPAGRRPAWRRIASALRPGGRGPVPKDGGEVLVPTYVDEPGAAHPVVTIDGDTGSPAMHLGDHAWMLDGHPTDDGLALLDELQARVVEVGDRFTHSWRPGDLVAFDNRVLLHRREPWRHRDETRALRRTAVWPEPVVPSESP